MWFYVVLVQGQETLHQNHIKQPKTLQGKKLFIVALKHSVFSFIVCFLLGNSPASQFYMPTFRNTMFHLHRHLPMKMGQCSDTSAYKIETPGNYPKENTLYSEHGKSLKSRCEEKEKTNKMQQLDAYYQLQSQHVSGIIMPIFRRTKALLLHLVCCSDSAGCGW